MVLLRMRPPTAGDAPLKLTVTYTDRSGRQFRWGLVCKRWMLMFSRTEV